ncbi:uroplakin-1a isoform X3 [Balaenoptera acutorostrata]|uniref:Uroplakin-1a isoform X3 n=1 Tax=Balaenoptera acutorostrata TaxID=9767 RepID=A0A383YQQ7_BALAC|nr:uroplakin-1a isoform X3 [Balaenoptera acutorostrata]
MWPDISTIWNFRHPPPFQETGPRRGLGIYREPLWEGLAREASGREGKTMASAAAATTEKGSPVVVGLLVVGNIIILLSGLALFAETVWVTADQYRVYPLMGVSGKDDVFAGAWIAIFCGFSFFAVASFGVGAALCRRRSMMLTQECCGTSGPTDWVNFTSAFRATTPEVVFPWPPLCCRRTGNFIPLSEEGCRLGHLDYLFTKMMNLTSDVWSWDVISGSQAPTRCFNSCKGSAEAERETRGGEPVPLAAWGPFTVMP